MEFQYPVTLKRSDGEVIATFKDVPEAITFGGDKEHALHEAEDALLVALSAYVDDKRPIPAPSKPTKRQSVVVVPPLAVAKIALHNALLDARLSNVALAEKMGLRETQIRRMLDLDHQSHISQIQQALRILGYEVVTSVKKVA